ncbi:MAG: CatB-related O-acetyltransferase [Magnetococcus sp. YQC-3]
MSEATDKTILLVEYILQHRRLGKQDEEIMKHLIKRGIDRTMIESVFFVIDFIVRQDRMAVPQQKIFDLLTARGIPSTLTQNIIDIVLENTKRYPSARHTYGLENILLHEWGEHTKLVIGSFCCIAEKVQIFIGGNHNLQWATNYPFGHVKQELFPHHGDGHPTTNGDVVIGNDVWLGTGCTIMSGVTIGDGAVVAANAHVVKDVGPYEIVGGNPAGLIRRKFTRRQIAALLELQWWNMPDANIKKIVPYLCATNIDVAIQKIREERASLLA